MSITKSRWFAGTLLCMLVASPAFAQEERLKELERKVEVLTEELAGMRLGAAADTGRYVSRFGLGPAASKVYAGRGISVGGYGEMLFEAFDREREDGALAGLTDRIDFLRQVLYVGFKFNDDLLFNSEVEIEHAGVQDEAEVAVDPGTGEGSAELSGEVVLEFAYIEWATRPDIGLRAGMLLAPVGLINEMHEPTVFIGARRPEVERNILPTTWRANGAGIFGELGGTLAYRAYLVEGLDATGFSASSSIRGGRQSGSQSLFTKPALTGRLDFSGITGLLVGVSGFTGDSWQGPQPATRLSPRVTVLDAHARLQWRGLEARGLYASGHLDDAGPLSDALGLAGNARLGEKFFGYYVEAGYDVLATMSPGNRYRLIPYARYERYDTQDDVPGGVENPALERTVATFGAAFHPHPNVVFKADRQDRQNEAEHRDLSVELRRRIRVLTGALVLVLAAGLAPDSWGTVYTTRPQALAEAFPRARIENLSYVLDAAQVKAVQQRARAKLESKLATAHLAWRGDTLVGTAFFDARNVRTMPGVFMVVVAPDSTIERVEVIAFHEPPDYRPPERWLGQFEHRRLDQRLWPRRDIRNLSGATLTTQAVTESARLALALYEVLVAPKLPPAGRAPRP